MVTISSLRLGFRWPPRTVTVKGGRRPSRSNSPLTVTSTAAGYVGRVSFPAVSANNVNSEGSSPSGAKIARILVFGRSVRIGTMMQSCASRRSSEAAGPFFIAAWKPWRSVGSPPPRIRHRQPCWYGPPMWLSCCCSYVPAIAHAAGRKMTPSGTSPVMTRRHSAMRSLRASATIIVLRVLPRPSAVRASNHFAKALCFWNLIKHQAN